MICSMCALCIALTFSFDLPHTSHTKRYCSIDNSDGICLTGRSFLECTLQSAGDYVLVIDGYSLDKGYYGVHMICEGDSFLLLFYA